MIDSLSKKKWEQGIIKSYGSLEAYKEAARAWRSKGGKNSPGVRNLTTEQRSEAGKKGIIAMRAKMKQELLNEIEHEMEEELDGRQ